MPRLGHNPDWLRSVTSYEAVAQVIRIYHGVFRIISLDSHDVAYAGAYRGGRLVEMPGEVAEFRLDFERMGHRALSDDASRTLIEQKLEAIT